MRRSFVCAAVIAAFAAPLFAYAQRHARLRVAADLGVVKPQNLPQRTTNILSLATGITVEKPLRLSNRLFLTTGLGLASHRYILDGYFQRTGNAVTFEQVGTGIGNNRLLLTMVKLPALLTFPLFEKNGAAVALNVGADLNFIFHGVRQYTRNGQPEKENFSVENRWQVPLRLEVSTLNLSRQKEMGNLFYGFGVRRQLTQYLRGPSFQPFEAYLRLGVQF